VSAPFNPNPVSLTGYYVPLEQFTPSTTKGKLIVQFGDGTTQFPLVAGPTGPPGTPGGPAGPAGPGAVFDADAVPYLNATAPAPTGPGVQPTNKRLVTEASAQGTYMPRAGGTAIKAAASPLFNVKDYGAKGDGVTDDTAAIRAAVAAAFTGTLGVGGTLFFPAGKFIVSSTINLFPGTLTAFPGVTIAGVGAGVISDQAKSPAGTQIISTIPAGGGHLFYCAGNLPSFTMRDLALVGPGQAGVAAYLGGAASIPYGFGDSGLTLVFAQNVTLQGVNAYGFTCGVNLTNCQKVNVLSTDIAACRNVGLAIVSCTGGVNVAGAMAHTTNDQGAAQPGEVVANYLIDGYDHTVGTQTNGVILGGPVYDETGLSSATGGQCVLIKAATNVIVTGGKMYAPGNSTTSTGPYYGINVGPVASNVIIQDLDVGPYTPSANVRMPTNTILIQSGATGVILSNVKTNPNGGGDILDNGTATAWLNVNGVDGNPAGRIPFPVTRSGSTNATGQVGQGYLTPTYLPARVVNGIALQIAVSSGNVDVGIYRGSTLMKSLGSTPCPAAGLATLTFPTPVKLPAGQYYVAVSFDNVTAAVVADTSGYVQLWQRTAVGLFPLPATAPATSAGTVAPVLVLT